MAYKQLPHTELLRKVLDYDPETGALTWKARPREHFRSQSAFVRWNKLHAGTPAFACIKDDNYKTGMLNSVHYYAHRIVWAYVNGPIPEGEIDHINGNRLDNRIANLRIVSRLENTQNRKIRKDSESGIAGVSWHKQSRKWKVTINNNRRMHYLGLYPCIALAVATRKAAEIKYGYHQNHGRPS